MNQPTKGELLDEIKRLNNRVRNQEMQLQDQDAIIHELKRESLLKESRKEKLSTNFVCHSKARSVEMEKTLIQECNEVFKGTFADGASVKEYAATRDVGWYSIGRYQRLSEEFMREFAGKLNWDWVSQCQCLSEEFIREFAEKLNWGDICACQRLSEEFMREFAGKLDWDWVSQCQCLSEDFIREFANKLNWHFISINQCLSESFIREFADNINRTRYDAAHRVTSIEERVVEMTAYAAKHKLQFDGKYLWAYRRHDICGRGQFTGSIFYETGKYYRDWHCDMRIDEENSFGLGIFPKGNTLVKVSVDDWGCAVTGRDDGKARVCGIEVCS